MQAQIGFVWPDTGDALERFEMASSAALTRAAGCAELSYSVGYSKGPASHSVEALQGVGEVDSIAEAGAHLSDQGAQAVVWACTSGSFIGGLEWSLQQRRSLRRQIGCPVTSGTLALISAALRQGFQTVDVLSPYPEDVSEIFRSCLRDAGLKVASMRMLHSPGATASANLPLTEECRRYAETGRLKGGALLIPDTAVNSLTLIGELEAAAGQPVLTVNQACVFEGAALIGRAAPLTRLPPFHRFQTCPEGKIL